MHIAPRARPVSPRASTLRITATAAALFVLPLLGCGSGASGAGNPLEAIVARPLSISPSTLQIGVGEQVTLRAASPGRSIVWRSLHASIVTVDASGRVTGLAEGAAGVVATAGADADTVQVAVAKASNPPLHPEGGRVEVAQQWRIEDDGHFVEVENPVLRLRFAYAAAGLDGWFIGGESSGGGGGDGGIAELYYKPTSTTRNLVFRNGQWGSIYDQMDLFEAEGVSLDRTDHDAPDFGSGRDARMLAHEVFESAGRLVARFEFQFRAWRILRTYIVYPWGDITVHAKITQTESGRFNYLAHRFIFAASRASFANQTTGEQLDWGSNFQRDREMMHAWSDGEPVYEYVEPIRDAVDRNTVLYEAGRQDAYSGFMMDDRNGNDPDIVVMNGDRRIGESPFQTTSTRFGGNHYVETALFSPRWAPDNLTHADMTWFYMGTACCEVRWSDAPLWGTELGSWEESFHVLLRQGLDPKDYLALWRSRAGSIEQEAPRAVVHATARLDSLDRLYHLTADSGAETVSWEWRRSATAEREVDYRTAFVVHGFDATAVRIEGEGAPEVVAYPDAARGELLVVLTGEQPRDPVPYRITLSR